MGREQMIGYNASEYQSVQEAVDAARGTGQDGTTVELIFPAGIYETGPVVLHSDMVLTLEAEDVIHISDGQIGRAYGGGRV